MVNVALALLATLAALGGAGLLVQRTLPDRRSYLLAWCSTMFALGFALGAMTIGFAAGFSPALLRAMVLFGSLIAPLTLAVGVVELVARTVQARFAARLIAASYSIVAVVIVLLDPIIGSFDKSLPKVGGHYSSLPGTVLTGAHAFAVVSLVACVTVTAVRNNRQDRAAAALLVPLAMIALAGVLVVTAMRGLLPGPLVPIVLGGAAALVWFGTQKIRPDRAHDDEEAEYDDMSRYPQQPYDDRAYGDRGYNDQYGDQRYDDQYQDQYPQQQQQQQQPSYAPPVSAQNPGQYGRIMIYTLIEGHGDAFDRLAAECARSVRENEPGTVVYACHTVDNALDQRIFYQLFRDAAAVEDHTRQPHVQRFAREARAHVSGTNVLELTVNTAMVALPAFAQAVQQPGPPPGHQTGPHAVPQQRPENRTGPHQVPPPPPDHRTGPRPAPPQYQTGPRQMPPQDHRTGPRPAPPPPDHRTGPHAVPPQPDHRTGPHQVPPPPPDHRTGVRWPNG